MSEIGEATVMGFDTRGGRFVSVVARLLVAVTAVLLCFGALVTTFDAAMAVPDWPGTYGHNMFLFPWAEWLHGPWDLFLEHGHRLLGALVGCVSLVLATAVWRVRATAAVRSLALAAVVLVVVQGALGGARVLLDDKTVAKVHACTGPLFFAVAVAIAALTGRRGSSSASNRHGAWTACGLVIASYLQLVAGAQLRHLDAAVGPAAFRWLVALHLLGAAAVATLSLVALARCRRASSAAARRWSLALAVLVGGQVLLGCLAWVASWGVPAAMLPEAWVPSEPVVARGIWSASVVTGHVVLGMLILGGSVALATAAGALDAATDGDSASRSAAGEAFA